MIILIITTIMLVSAGSWIYDNINEMFKAFFMNAHQDISNQDQALEYLKMAVMFGLRIVTPLFIALLVTAVLVNIAQTGVIFTTKPLEAKPDRLDPIQGIKRLFSMRGAVELVKGFGKIFIVGVVIYFTVRTEVDTFTQFVVLPVGTMLGQAGNIVLFLVIRILAALLILSILDALYSRFQYLKDLRMTKQEIKDEHKQHEGDPFIKSKRRQKAVELSKRRLDHAILKSNAVVTNPTHYAVALQYDPETDQAPVVTAKGVRKRALKIKELAARYDVPVVENPPVARALYATAEEDTVIPPKLYKAVAEILAYVYRLQKQKLQ